MEEAKLGLVQDDDVDNDEISLYLEQYSLILMRWHSETRVERKVGNFSFVPP
jgi:hypothetical protein